MTLFDPADPMPGGVHTNDPDTSREAAHAKENQLRWGSQRYDLLLAYMGRPAGLTPDEAGARIGVGGYNQRRRASELTASGLLAPTGVERNGARVLAITTRGEAALRAAAATKPKDIPSPDGDRR